MNRIFAAMGIVLTCVLGVSCGSTTQIPPGGQVVRVSAVDNELRLEPPSVQPGDVYLVLEQSAPSVNFVYRDDGTGDHRNPPLPVTDDDIRSMEEQGTFRGSFVIGLAVHGQGNVFKVGPLVDGKYLLVGDRDSLAILEVVTPSAT